MKEIIIMIALALGITGCTGSQAQKSTETTKSKTELTTEVKNTTETTTQNKNEATPDQKWTDIVPDYKKIFKGAEITYESLLQTPADEYGALYVTLEGVTREQFEKYVKEAAKRYTNVQNKGSVDSINSQYINYMADDGVYQITLIMSNNLEDHDKLDGSIACLRNTWEDPNSTTEQ